MQREEQKIKLIAYCTKKEIEYTKRNLKKQLFTQMYNKSEEMNNYIFQYADKELLINEKREIYQVVLVAIYSKKISSLNEDLEGMFIVKKGNIFSFISKVINKITRRHKGEYKMITRCSRCGNVIPVKNDSTNELVIALQEANKKNKDLEQAVRELNEKLIVSNKKLLEAQKTLDSIEREKIVIPVVDETNGNVSDIVCSVENDVEIPDFDEE